jgi:8-oxo-dGTP pyrophosphatase MutT (NUDIX family)
MYVMSHQIDPRDEREDGRGMSGETVGAWRRGAGILLATRDAAGDNYVVLGCKAASQKPWKQLFAEVGYSLHGWTIPFGTLDAADDGDFARCAIRETAQELLGIGEHVDYASCRSELARALCIPADGLEARLQAGAGGGLLTDHRVFFLRVPFQEAFLGTRYPGNWEFPGGLRWYRYLSPDDVRDRDEGLGKPWHRALRSTLARFDGAITQQG